MTLAEPDAFIRYRIYSLREDGTVSAGRNYQKLYHDIYFDFFQFLSITSCTI